MEGTISQDIIAGTPGYFPGGKLFCLLETDYPVNLTFLDYVNKEILFAENVEEGVKVTPEKPFNRVRVDSASNQTIKAFITGGQIENDRIVGSVEVDVVHKDQTQYYYSINDMAFFASQFSPASSTGKYSFIEFWNPADSGINAIINKLEYSCDTTDYAVELRHHNAAIGGIQPTNSKKIDSGPASECEIYISFASALKTGSLLCYLLKEPSIWKPKLMDMRDSYIIEPGNGLLIHGTIVNLGVYGFFEWIEVAV